MIEPIVLPTCKIADLGEQERKVLLIIIREFTKTMPEAIGMLGFDMTEETIMNLIDKGIIKIVYDEDNDGYYLRVYDFNQGRYRP